MSRITRIEPVIVHVNARGDWLIAQVHCDDGLIGLGEASHGGNDSLVLAVLDCLELDLVGRDPSQINRLCASMHSADAGRVQQTAASAIEQALWDLLGQRLGVPLHVLLGGAVRDRVRLYANINRGVSDRSPAGFAIAAGQAVSEAFGAVKLAPFDEVSGPDRVRSGARAAWRTGVERVRAVRAAIGTGVELMVDCHGRFDVDEALEVAHQLEDCSLSWLEEPVPQHDIASLEHVRARVGMPIASGESAFGVEGFAPFVRDAAADIIMPDVKHDGGILETTRIAALARAGRVAVSPHNPSGPVSTAVSAHVASTLPDVSLLEYAWGEASWRAALLDPPERIVDGHLLLPSGNGLGHRLAAACVDEHRATSARNDDSSRVDPRQTGKGEP